MKKIGTKRKAPGRRMAMETGKTGCRMVLDSADAALLLRGDGSMELLVPVVDGDEVSSNGLLLAGVALLIGDSDEALLIRVAEAVVKAREGLRRGGK